MYRQLKGKRIQFRLEDETFYRIKYLAEYRKITMTRLIEQLVEEAWLDQIAMRGFDVKMYPR